MTLSKRRNAGAGAFLLSSAALLAACDGNRAAPALENAASPTTVPTPVADSSVPSAKSVLTPPAGAAPPTGSRTNAPLTAAQESTAMPMAGQANDHSAPKAEAKPASAP